MPAPLSPPWRGAIYKTRFALNSSDHPSEIFEVHPLLRTPNSSGGRCGLEPDLLWARICNLNVLLTPWRVSCRDILFDTTLKYKKECSGYVQNLRPLCH